MATTSRIAVARSFGSPDVISLENHALPHLAAGAVRAAVRAAGLNPVDARRRSGGFGGRPPLTFGSEFAGVVVESADPNTPVGAELVGWTDGGANADLIDVDPRATQPKPEGLDWLTAGGLSGAGQTALTVLDTLNLAPGAVVLIHGAAGGVGTLLTQLAVARGLVVLGTASPKNLDFVRSLGATALDYTGDLPAQITAAAGRPIAASIDLAGSRQAGDLAVAIRQAGGAAVTLVPETMQSHGIQILSSQKTPARLRELLARAVDGSLVLPVEGVPFAELPAAHARMDAKHATGKLVLDLSDNPHLPASAR
ncbi:zinc-binding dehydrogenase [Galactobacter valiniphilus]|uniref:zinc-binding dehydrogenase n=1 Tax=Galactobacter valiniphilus TaxID=2676122 RepID=UPI0037351F36